MKNTIADFKNKEHISQPPPPKKKLCDVFKYIRVGSWNFLSFFILRSHGQTGIFSN